jgi:Tfp pilus assembly protein PilO
MFGRIRVYLIMFAAFAAFAGVAYWYYLDTQQSLKQYAENQAKLEQALQAQTQAFEKLQRDMLLMQETQEQLQEDFLQSRELTKSLETLFNTDADGNPRDFDDLAAQDPDLVTEELNTGTQEVFECFEQLSRNQNNGGNKKYINCFNID